MQILNRIKNILNRYPRLKALIRKIVPNRYLAKASYKVKQESSEQKSIKQFESFYIQDTLIHFSLLPLEDQRGIGRVTQEQLSYFTKTLPLYTKQSYTKEIYFYSSIHWCPQTLQKNTIVMIHDVTPLVLHELFEEASKIWNTKFKNIAHQAQHIITISQNSKNDIHKYLDIPKVKISVVSNGVTALKIAKQTSLQLPKQYFAYLGAYDVHKNLDVLFRALTHPECKEYHLVLIGDNFSSKQSAKKLNILDRVHFLGKLPDAEVGFVMKNANLFLFPSLYEGFGLPPMEAALLKTPSICSNRPTMSEFLSDVVLFCDAYNDKEWAQTMHKLMQDSQQREELANASFKLVKEYTWEKSCTNLVQKLIQ